MKYEGIVISDIHFGAIDPMKQKNELSEIFLYYLDNLKKLDFIVITGDYFDHKIYVSDSTSNYALSFMNRLVDIAKRFKCPIRIIYGTESHEVNQYNIFSIYEHDTDVDFKVIRTVSDEELCKGLNVLYIPEEYIFSKKDYYKDYLSKDNYYNYIFGHGVVQDVMTDAVRQTNDKSESTRKKVPYFTTKELFKICNGQVYFGHYHINTNIDDKFFYVGSYSRFQHGEESPKGFYHIKCNIDDNKYKEEFIENTMASKYVTYTYSYTSDAIQNEDELLKELKRMDKLNEINDNDHVRFIFNIPENHPNPEFIINILNERYKYSDNIKVKIVNGYVEKKKKINKEKLHSALDEYPMIFDKSIKLEDKIIYFIKKKWDREISSDKVKIILYDNCEIED